MSIVGILIASGIIFIIAYRFYGRFIAKKLSISNTNETPAHTLRDDVDYVPSKTPVVLGHHFASIAGAGPIVGPVIAVAFGWIPALLWIIFGSIFFGAVHDLTSMVASLRHQGKSIGIIIETYIGSLGKKLFLVFGFATLVLVIAVFGDIVARTFAQVPSAATASVGFIGLAVLYGLLTRRFAIPLSVATAVGVILMYGFIFIGEILPLQLSYTTWIWILLLYIFFGAVTPVWVLLQPRDYLNSYLLYGMMILGLLGVLIANPTVVMDTSINYDLDSLGYLFPVLFVTIACGAISGFHSLVASGTTSKQIDKEENAIVIGFGGMLIEGMLAVLALCSVIVLSRSDYLTNLGTMGPVTLFSQGLGGFIATLGIPATIAVSFVALTVSAFALTSLDTCTRLARFALQEYFEKDEQPFAKHLAKNRYSATLITIAVSMLLIFSGEFSLLWPIFGSANQLLGALALLAVTVWLYKSGINPIFTLIPMFFMFAVTLTSLVFFAWKHFSESNLTLGIIALLLFGLSIILLLLAKRSLNAIIQQNNTETRTA